MWLGLYLSHLYYNYLLTGALPELICTIMVFLCHAFFLLWTFFPNFHFD